MIGNLAIFPIPNSIACVASKWLCGSSVFLRSLIFSSFADSSFLPTFRRPAAFVFTGPCPTSQQRQVMYNCAVRQKVIMYRLECNGEPFFGVCSWFMLGIRVANHFPTRESQAVGLLGILDKNMRDSSSFDPIRHSSADS